METQIKLNFEKRFDLLTDRECQVAYLVITGKSVKEVATVLCISPNTVNNHKNNIFRKYGVMSSTELIYKAFLSNFPEIVEYSTKVPLQAI